MGKICNMRILNVYDTWVYEVSCFLFISGRLFLNSLSTWTANIVRNLRMMLRAIRTMKKLTGTTTEGTKPSRDDHITSS